MGLHVFIGKADPQVLIVESFRQNPGSSFAYFSGRPRTMTFKDFRARGVAVLKAHLKLFKTKIVGEKDIIPVFVLDEAERLLRKRSAVSIGPDYFNEGKELRFCALRFRKYDLGWMFDVGREPSLLAREVEYCAVLGGSWPSVGGCARSGIVETIGFRALRTTGRYLVR